jgi:DNA-binding PadR family transcriptional regulator
MNENKLLLLGLLRRQEMHGYRMFEFIDRELSICTDLKKPTAYFLLTQMEKDGWVWVEHEREGNRPPRKVYHLTEEGERAFWHLLEENLSTFTPVFFPGDMGLSFVDQVERKRAIELLQQRRQALLQAIAMVEQVPSHSGTVQLVIEHQKSYLNNESKWLDDLISTLQNTVD